MSVVTEEEQMILKKLTEECIGMAIKYQRMIEPDVTTISIMAGCIQVAFVFSKFWQLAGDQESTAIRLHKTLELLDIAVGKS